MRNLRYCESGILIVLWAIGFFAFHAGFLIHILIVTAIVSITLKIANQKHISLINLETA